MSDKDYFFENILKSMNDGVMTLSSDGKISMFNNAASMVLGIPVENVINHSFAEVFMMEMEDNDDFNQTILDAIYQNAKAHTNIVSFKRPDKKVITLKITSSYLSSKNKQKSSRGIVIVFHDITEMENLRIAEQDLNRKLLESCRLAEETNINLKSAQKKVRTIRIISTISAIILFLGIGYMAWDQQLLDIGTKEKEQKIETNSGIKTRETLIIAPRPVSSSISLYGILAPIEKINIASPIQAIIIHKNINFGATVKKGDLLAQLDSSDFETKVKSAETEYIKALQHFRNLKDWQNSMEVSRGKRSLLQAQRSIEKTKRKFEETKLLFARGIVSANDFEAAKEAVQSAEQVTIAAKEELTAVNAKGNKENLTIARFSMENAKRNKEKLIIAMNKTKIFAPISGVVLKPPENEKNKKPLEKGSMIKEGQIFCTIANLDGLSVKTKIDEVDVSKIKNGQAAKVYGEAFKEIPLSGIVKSISYQAVSRRREQPTFEVIININNLTEEQRQRIRLGMSANLEVIIYNNPEAVLIPIPAVIQTGRKKLVLLKNNENGEVKEVPVETGLTTYSSVEITKGLKAGDEIVISR
jgi:HlyD family secretion protein